MERKAIIRTQKGNEFEATVVETRERPYPEVKISYWSAIKTLEEAWVSSSQVVRYLDSPCGDGR